MKPQSEHMSLRWQWTVLLCVLLCTLTSGCAGREGFSLFGGKLSLQQADGASASGDKPGGQGAGVGVSAVTGAENGAAGKDSAMHGASAGTVLPYTVRLGLADGPGRSSYYKDTGAPSVAQSTAPGTPGAEKGPPPALMEALEGASLLRKLQDSPPDDLQGLEFRVDKDEAEALRLLRAFGYYGGTVTRHVTRPDISAGTEGATTADVAVPATLGTAAAGTVGFSGPAAPVVTQAARAAGTDAADVTAGEPALATGLTTSQVTGLATGQVTDRETAENKAPRWQVDITLTPGPLYHVGESAVRYVPLAGAATTPSDDAHTAALPSPALPSSAPSDVVPSAEPAFDGPQDAPTSLAEAGLPDGSPAVAERILRAVEGLPDILARRGYPLAKVLETHYVVDKDTHKLYATVLVDSGPRVRMGRVRLQGESAVNPSYPEKLRGWEVGDVWDQQQVEQLRDTLTRQGLFRSLRLEPVPSTGSTAAPSGSTGAPMPTGDAGQSLTPLYDLLLNVADAPQRTVGGGLNYESDRGLGAQGYWEHRNFFGQGERFRAEATLWQDSQFARASLRKPAFLDRSQELTADAWLRNEDTIAYKQRAAWASASVERRLWKGLYASAGIALEGGDLEDAQNSRRGYTMTGIPLGLRYEGAGDVLDPVRGWRANFSVKPLWGTYGEDFTAFPTRLSLSTYWPLGRMSGTDASREIYRVVLAARLAAGSLWREESWRIPAAARYYGGGGGSVRGYAYQSLGPRDARTGDPLGGASFAEVSLEARVRITEDLALVPFLDGGNVFASAFPWPGQGSGAAGRPGSAPWGGSTGDDVFQWGAGLGLRYHTAIGPVRLDVATPLNPRKDDGPVFIYISIGQSF